jgi:hypothetical protein
MFSHVVYVINIQPCSLCCKCYFFNMYFRAIVTRQSRGFKQYLHYCFCYVSYSIFSLTVYFVDHCLSCPLSFWPLYCLSFWLPFWYLQMLLLQILKLFLFEYNYKLIHGHFHIGLVIIPRLPYWPETQSRANIGRGMITRPIWKCPCIKLFITYFRHLEKRHPYWSETKSRPILANMGLDMEMILKQSNNRLFSRGVKIWTVYFRSYWSYKNAFIWTKYVINTIKT